MSKCNKNIGRGRSWVIFHVFCFFFFFATSFCAFFNMTKLSMLKLDFTFFKFYIGKFRVVFIDSKLIGKSPENLQGISTRLPDSYINWYRVFFSIKMFFTALQTIPLLEGKKGWSTINSTLLKCVYFCWKVILRSPFTLFLRRLTNRPVCSILGRTSSPQNVTSFFNKGIISAKFTNISPKKLSKLSQVKRRKLPQHHKNKRK